MTGPRRSLAQTGAWLACLALGLTLPGACSQSLFIQSPYDALPRVSSEDVDRLHPAQALRDDLEAIVDLHERTSPNPYLRVSQEAIRAQVERLKASIDRPLTRREFLPLVMELQAAYRSDHYGQWVPEEDLAAAFARGERLLPFRAAPDGEGLIVVAVSGDESALDPGDRIVRIGNVPADVHLARLRTLAPEESSRYRDTRVREQFRTLSWAAGVTLPAEIEVVRADGSRRTVTVEGVGEGAREGERLSPAGVSPQGAAGLRGEVLIDSPPFRLVLLSGDLPEPAPIALIDFPDMNGVLRGRWDAFLDQAVLAANERGAAGLIVDIRKNSGGSSSLGDALIARLTDRPYRMAAGAVWRRSPESDETFSMMAKPEWRWLTVALPIFLPNYTRLRQGEDLTEMVDVASRPRAEPAFRRPAVLLIGDETASSAMMLADAARTFDLMLTIGQPTGGLPNSLGDVGPFQLPNSKIPVSFSQKLFIRASGDASDLGPVRPHIEVAPIAGSDSALERAILEIRRMNASSHAFGVSGG
jgi:hypothetical protein